MSISFQFIDINQVRSQDGAATTCRTLETHKSFIIMINKHSLQNRNWLELVTARTLSSPCQHTM